MLKYENCQNAKIRKQSRRKYVKAVKTQKYEKG